MLGDDFNRLDWYILGYLVDFSQNDDHPYHRMIPSTDFGLHADQGMREAIAESLNKLDDAQLIFLRFDDGLEDTVIESQYPEITPKGIYYILQNVFTYFENEHDLIWDFPTNVGETLHGILEGVGEPIEPLVPASNRIVSRTDNQGAWDEATTTLDAVIAEYKKDHPRDNEVGSEKTALLGALIAGRKLFDDTRINVEVGVALLIEPLKLIVRRYEKELIGGLAATAFAAIAKL